MDIQVLSNLIVRGGGQMTFLLKDSPVGAMLYVIQIFLLSIDTNKMQTKQNFQAVKIEIHVKLSYRFY